RLRLAALLAVLADHRDARLPSEGWVRQHYVEVDARLGRKRVYAALDRRRPLFAERPDPVQEKVHRAQPRDGVHEVGAVDELVAKPLLLVAVEFRPAVGLDVLDGREEESARPAR